MTEDAGNIVCDTGPIIHLDELGCLSLLSDFKQIFLAVSVVEEIKKHRLDALAAQLPFRVLRPSDPANGRLLAMCRIFALDRGEIESLIIMEHHPDALFLTDDASARMVAERMGHRVHGTIGIIIRAIRREQKSAEEVMSIMSTIRSKSTLFVKPSLLREITVQIKKEFNL